MTPMFLWILACRGDPDPTPSDSNDTDVIQVETGSTGDTGATDLPIACSERDGNRLRFDCVVSYDEATTLQLEVRPTDGSPSRSYVSDGTANPQITVWFLLPETTYSLHVTLRSGEEVLTGELTTRSLPKAADVQGVVTGSGSVDALLVAANCPQGWVYVLDSQGRVLWYEDIAGRFGFTGAISGLHHTEDDTVLMTVARSAVVELDWAGNVRLERRKGVDFDAAVHHDVTRRDGITYVLRADRFTLENTDWVLDGVLAFDDTGLVGEFGIEDAGFPLVSSPFDTFGYWASTFPAAHDYSHANSISIADDGDVLISFRHLHSVIRFTGGPGTPEFGTVEWVATGRDDSHLWPGDLTADPVDGARFGGQHHTTLAADGSLWMMDNGWDAGQLARGVRYALDFVGGEMSVLASWDMGLECPVQGAAFPLDDGGVLLTCASEGLIAEYPAESGSEAEWEMQVTCDGPSSVFVARGVPLEL